MTRKHFNSVAHTIKIQAQRTDDPHALRALCAVTYALADEFSAFNSNFDKGRFITACGF